VRAPGKSTNDGVGNLNSSTNSNLILSLWSTAFLLLLLTYSNVGPRRSSNIRRRTNQENKKTKIIAEFSYITVASSPSSSVLQAVQRNLYTSSSATPDHVLHSGGFGHVQHVRPNRGPHNSSGKFFASCRK